MAHAATPRNSGRGPVRSWGWVPANAGDQAFEFGNCLTRRHAEGAWVCLEENPAPVATAAGNKKKAVARVADYRRYSFSEAGTYYWGIYLNGVAHVYGSLEWQRSGNFNGRQGQFSQSGDVLTGPTVRYDFRIEKYRSTSAGWEPQTADGTWYSVRYDSKPYHCVDSLASCYFKGY